MSVQCPRGNVWCWGANSAATAQSNPGDASCSGDTGGAKNCRKPAKIPSLSGIDHIAVGNDYSCALKKVDRAGLVLGGQRLWSTRTRKPKLLLFLPTIVPSVNASSLSIGYSHNCIITSNGGVSCWGRNGKGALGHDPALDREKAEAGKTSVNSAPMNVAGLSKLKTSS